MWEIPCVCGVPAIISVGIVKRGGSQPLAVSDPQAKQSKYM